MAIKEKQTCLWQVTWGAASNFLGNYFHSSLPWCQQESELDPKSNLNNDNGLSWQTRPHRSFPPHWSRVWNSFVRSQGRAPTDLQQNPNNGCENVYPFVKLQKAGLAYHSCLVILGQGENCTLTGRVSKILVVVEAKEEDVLCVNLSRRHLLNLPLLHLPTRQLRRLLLYRWEDGASTRHTAGEWQNQNSNPGPFDCDICFHYPSGSGRRQDTYISLKSHSCF